MTTNSDQHDARHEYHHNNELKKKMYIPNNFEVILINQIIFKNVLLRKKKKFRVG